MNDRVIFYYQIIFLDLNQILILELKFILRVVIFNGHIINFHKMGLERAHKHKASTKTFME